ncbi:MAG: FTR1 family iron permease [Thermoleophilia bacterium]|nr:FTR1 family iron permease [Thermoleophilia bacterium]
MSGAPPTGRPRCARERGARTVPRGDAVLRALRRPRVGPVLSLALALSLACGVIWGAGTASAQSSSPWQVAERIRDLAFEAQNHLYAADRGEQPAAHREAALALLEEARTAYVEALQPDLRALAPAADRVIAEVLGAARAAAEEGNGSALAAARGRLWAGLVGGSYRAALASLGAGDADAAALWLRLREYREATKAAPAATGAAEALNALRAGERSPAEALAAVDSDLRDAYFYRLRNALNDLSDAAEKGFVTRAAEWAGLARGYFEILRDDFAGKRGDGAAASLAGVLAAVEEAAVGGDWRAVESGVGEARSALAEYQPVELTGEEVAERANLLYLFLDLVRVEYRDGVRDGEIVIPIEYQEAMTFRAQAHGIFEELRPILAAADSGAAARLEELLGELESVLADLGDRVQVERLVEEALTLVESTLEVQTDTSSAAAAFPIISTLLDEVLSSARQGRYEDAERARLEAYAVFESGPELNLAQRAPGASRELEGLFWEGAGGSKGLATLLREHAAPGEIETAIAALTTKLAEAERLLGVRLSGISAAAHAAVIIIREGLEALLIVGAILGYLRATGEPRKYRLWTYAGVAAAIVLSLLTWVAARSLVTISVANRELIEGVASLIAVAVLFYVTNWLFHKVYVVDWMTFIKGKVGKAVTGGSALALAGLGFTVVYREGFETVLFYQALLFDASSTAVLLGFVAGSAVILALAYAILRLSVRVPLKLFFTITGLVMLLLAFSFTGAGIRELQEAGIVTATLLEWMPENVLLMETLGIFPTVETTLAQALFVCLIASTFIYSRWRGQRDPARPVAIAEKEGA